MGGMEGWDPPKGKQSVNNKAGGFSEENNGTGQSWEIVRLWVSVEEQ